MARPARSGPRPATDSVRLAVHVKPRSRRSVVLGVRGGVLEVSVSSPPIEGEANRELVTVIAGHFGLPKASVTILAGASGRRKWILLHGIDPARVATRLAEAESP
jgi:uncharacterized protein